MIWFWAVVLVLVIGASAVVVAGRRDAMTDVYEDRPDTTVDRGPLTSDDVSKVRFTTAVRGYRMDEVDAFVERVEAELRTRSTQASPDDAVAGGDHYGAADTDGSTRRTSHRAETADAAEPRPAPTDQRAGPGQDNRPVVAGDRPRSAAPVPGTSDPPGGQSR